MLKKHWLHLKKDCTELDTNTPYVTETDNHPHQLEIHLNLGIEPAEETREMEIETDGLSLTPETKLEKVKEVNLEE